MKATRNNNAISLDEISGYGNQASISGDIAIGGPSVGGVSGFNSPDAKSVLDPGKATYTFDGKSIGVSVAAAPISGSIQGTYSVPIKASFIRL